MTAARCEAARRNAIARRYYHGTRRCGWPATDAASGGGCLLGSASVKTKRTPDGAASRMWEIRSADHATRPKSRGIDHVLSGAILWSTARSCWCGACATACAPLRVRRCVCAAACAPRRVRRGVCAAACAPLRVRRCVCAAACAPLHITAGVMGHGSRGERALRVAHRRHICARPCLA